MSVRKAPKNAEIAQMLAEMAVFYEMQDVPFKPRAYENAASGIAGLSREVRDLYAEGGADALEDLPGVGKGIAAHLKTLIETGHFPEYEKLKEKTPVDVAGLTAIEGVGAQTVKTLWKELGVRTIDDLERAAREGKVQTLSGFGKKTEENILSGIAFLRESGGRRALGDILPDIRALKEHIAEFDGAEKVEIAGSLRRWKETVGDVDILIASQKPERVTEQFLELPEITHVYGSGETKTNVRLRSGIDCDLRVVPPESWGAALNYFTGAKAHNIALRKIAQKHGWKLSEYGLFDKNDKQIAGETEGDLYEKLGLAYVPPELREDTGELEAAQSNTLPALIEYGDLAGDLQTQTEWTDGAASIEEMARAARDAGLSYIAITDHTKALAMTGGADEEKLRRQMKAIDALNEKLSKHSDSFTILKGAEVNIGKNGTLDIADDVLAELDIVGAAVHSYFTLPKDEQMARVRRAMDNPHVDIIFHLTGRLIGKRKAIELDVPAIIAHAKETGTVLEIDAFPDRLDIADDYIRMCVEQGVKMSIDSDAHSTAHFAVLEYGIAQARRGWATKSDIINTLPADKLRAELAKPKEERWK